MSYPVQPKKEPRLMTRKENLEWELECLKVYKSRCKDESRLPGYTARMLDIEAELAGYKKDELLVAETTKIKPDAVPVNIPEPFKPEEAKEQVKEVFIKPRKPAKKSDKKSETSIFDPSNTPPAPDMSPMP